MTGIHHEDFFFIIYCVYLIYVNVLFKYSFKAIALELQTTPSDHGIALEFKNQGVFYPNDV